MFSGQAVYALPVSPQEYSGSSGGLGLDLSMERLLNQDWTMGLSLTQASFKDVHGVVASFSALSLISRYSFGEWGGLNPYVVVGFGADIFKDSFKQAFGDVLGGQLRLGSTYVLDSCWAVDYGAGYHLVAPVSAPYQYVDVRLGLDYRFGTQPKVNNNRPPVVVARQVDMLTPTRRPESAYSVAPGDCLYKIAQRPDVFGNADLWPLLYWNNSTSLADPNRVQPGQVISIRKDYGPEEKQKALQESYRAPEVNSDEQ